MISKALSKEAKEDFDIVVMVAQNIGLADNPPYLRDNRQQQIANTASHRKRKRKVNHSDLFPIQKDNRGKEVRERGLSQRSLREESRSYRKGSVKDVIMEKVKAYEDPQQFILTQKTILNKDLLRARRQSKDAKRILQLSNNKQKRSKILGEISEGVAVSSWTSRKPLTAPLKYFGEKRNGHKTGRSASYEKLGLSLDFSKFQLVFRRDGVGILSGGKEERRTQTARTVSRRVQMCFNSSNRPEFLYPCDDNESGLF